MTLKEYLKEEDVRPSEFARRIGLHRSTISLWMSGVRMPTPHNAVKIQDLTEGKVTYLDFLEGFRNKGEPRNV